MKILDVMAACIAAPRAEMSPYAPRIGSRGMGKLSAIPRQLPPRATAVHFHPEENLHLAADGRHADAIPAVRDAGDDTGEQAAVVRNDG